MSKKVSIIIPVHNAQNYLSECLDSLVNQTLKDIEIICVDDYSSDDSVRIVKEYAKKDNRIKHIIEPGAVGTSKARKDGVAASTGEYIMFLDADDMFSPDACAEAYALILEKKADIVHFNTKILTDDTNKQHVEIMHKFQKPPKGFVDAENLPAACFDARLFGWNLWNKIYNGDMCRRAFAQVCNDFLIKAEDMYVFFILLSMAKSYYGAEKSDDFYLYRLGAGGTGKTVVSLELMEAFCNEHASAMALKAYLEQNDLFDKYEKTYENIFNHLLKDCVWNWFEFVPGDVSAQGFDILCRYWGAIPVISMLTKEQNSKFPQIAKKVRGAKCLEPAKTENVKTIGIFYHRYFEGGVERVLSLLLPMYIQMGYRVVFFSDSVKPEREYPMPEDVIRVHTPSAITIPFGNYKKRAKCFADAIQEYNVDVMIYHAASCRLLLSDTMVIKSLGVPMIAMKHEMFSQHMVVASSYPVDYMLYYQLLDKLLVLSEIEAKYCRCLGVNAEYMQNPIDDFHPSPYVGDYIFWLGRFDSNQKQYLDAVEIFDKVVSSCPDAQMIMLGGEYDPGSKDRLLTEIKKRGLQKNLHVHEFTNDVENYYKNARVHLVTSAYEAFPMTFIESKSYGIPLVTYNMPYLQILQDGKGYIAVEQGDTDAAADALITLWQNRALCEQMSAAALESIAQFKDFDLQAAWKNVIDSVCMQTDNLNSYNDTMSAEEVECVVSTMLFHYQKGLQFMQAKENDLAGALWSSQNALKKEKKKTKKLQTKVKSLTKKNKKLRKSFSFRIGRMITYIPRRLKKALKKK